MSGRTHHHGYTLVEMLVVISITAGVLGTVTLTLQAMFRVDTVLRAEASEQLMLPRLSRQLRSDTHAAHSVRVVNQPAAPQLHQAVLQVGPRDIEYVLMSGEIRRYVRGESEVLQTERYFLPSLVTARWSTDAGGDLLELQLQRRLRDTETIHTQTISAVVGLHTAREDVE